MRHVPMVVCPFHGDQTANAERITERGIAKTLNIHEQLDFVQVKNIITEIIANER
jgi:UDP:flavonoid glycosyltransferase YjiC (YdhE family)